VPAPADGVALGAPSWRARAVAALATEAPGAPRAAGRMPANLNALSSPHRAAAGHGGEPDTDRDDGATGAAKEATARGGLRQPYRQALDEAIHGISSFRFILRSHSTRSLQVRTPPLLRLQAGPVPQQEPTTDR